MGFYLCSTFCCCAWEESPPPRMVVCLNSRKNTEYLSSLEVWILYITTENPTWKPDLQREDILCLHGKLFKVPELQVKGLLFFLASVQSHTVVTYHLHETSIHQLYPPYYQKWVKLVIKDVMSLVERGQDSMIPKLKGKNPSFHKSTDLFDR